MTDRTIRACQSEEEFEYIETEEELDAYLGSIVPYIGWVIVYFNSLEDHVSDFIREAILRDPIQDERLDVFLSGMLFSAKCNALIHLYGQMISSGAVNCPHEHLNELESMLAECSKRRNEYAHADWIGVKKGNFVRVKSQSKKLGIFHRYRKFEIPEIENDIVYIADARRLLCSFNDMIHDQLIR